MGRWLVLGNSPALRTVDLADIPDTVTTIGVNRIARSGYVPDYIMLLKAGDVEDEYVPAVGLIKGGVVCLPKGKFAYRSDAIHILNRAQSWQKMPQLPVQPSEPFHHGGGACWAVQFALTHGATHIGVIGIDWNAGQSREAKQATHFYGHNTAFVIPPDLPSIDELMVWRAMLDAAECWNLSPYPETPFDKVGWPRKPWKEWLSQGEVAATTAATTIPGLEH